MSQRGTNKARDFRGKEDRQTSDKNKFRTAPPDDRSAVPPDVDIKQYPRRAGTSGPRGSVSQPNEGNDAARKSISIDWSLPIGTEKMQIRQLSVPCANPMQNESSENTIANTSVEFMNQITAGTAWQSRHLKLSTVEQDTIFTQKIQDNCTNRILIVAEKPSVASSIAKAQLGESLSHENGVYKGTSKLFSNINTNIHKTIQNTEVWVSNVTGRIASVDYAEDQSDWETVDPLYLFTAPLVRRVTNKTTVQGLVAAAKYCHTLICATDADPAGDRIAQDIATICKGSLRGGSIKRVRFSGLGQKELQSSFSQLSELDILTARAVGAREEADLRVGTAFTRLQTRFLLPRWNFSSYKEDDKQKKVGKPVKFISYGPCQTPTQALCVAQEDIVLQFQKEVFYQLEMYLNIDIRTSLEDINYNDRNNHDNTSTSGNIGYYDTVDTENTTNNRNNMNNNKDGDDSREDDMKAVLKFLEHEYSGQTLEEEDTSIDNIDNLKETRKKDVVIPPSSTDVKKITTNPASRLKVSWTGLYTHSSTYVQSQYSRICEETSSTVVDIVKQEKSISRPYPLNTVAMLISICRAQRLTSHSAMSAAEALYLQGYISYPRTESTVYDASLRIADALSMLQEYLPEACACALQGPKQAKLGGDSTGDHPAITPLKPPHGLSGVLFSVYMLIARSFVASVSPDARILTMQLLIECKTIPFTTTLTSILEEGFYLALPHRRPTCITPIDIVVGQSIGIHQIEMVSKTTTCPSYLTEPELIQKMASLGIGTDASIPVHINNIQQRGYVERIRNQLVPTTLGRVLISCYRNADPEQCLPQLRATTERQFQEIALNHTDPIKCLEHVLLAYRAKAVLLVTRAQTIDDAMREHFQPKPLYVHNTIPKRIGQCGTCNSFLIYIEKKHNRYLYCKQCDQSLPLPKVGNIIELPLRKCPLDNFTLLQVSMPHSHPTQYQFCPLCISHQQGEDSITTCDTCYNSHCEYSVQATALGPCANYTKCKGMMILQPERHLSQCNTCALLLYIHPDATSMGQANKQTLSVPLEQLEDIHTVYDLLHNIKDNPKEVQINTLKGLVQVELNRNIKKKKKCYPLDKAVSAVEKFVKENPSHFFPLLRQKTSTLWTVQKPISPYYTKDQLNTPPAICGICNRRLVVIEQAVSDKEDHTWIRGCVYCDLQIAKKSNAVWGNDE